MAERADIPVFKNSPIMVLVLGFCTCGLYMIYWNMKVAEIFNKISGREVISTPIAVLAGATAALPHGLDHHLVPAPVDDSPEARARHEAAEDAILVDPQASAAATVRRTAASQRLRHLQALLAPRPVAIPDIASIALPAGIARSRLHRDTLIGLIQASALLHQHQRPTIAGCVVVAQKRASVLP